MLPDERTPWIFDVTVPTTVCGRFPTRVTIWRRSRAEARMAAIALLTALGYNVEE
jgi:hypothetical protein